MNVIKEPKKWYIKLFTLGKNFSSKTFSDNFKRLLLNAIALFIVVTFTFYVENQGDEFGRREEYLDVSKSISQELDSIITYTDRYKKNLTSTRDILAKQFKKWDKESDSVFVDYIEEYDAYFPPLTVFNTFLPYNPINNNFKLFKTGSLEFFLINKKISAQILELYEGRHIGFLVEKTDVGERQIINQFNKITTEKWTNDLSMVDLNDINFWIKNRKYIQNDSEVKSILLKRLRLWDFEVFNQINSFQMTIKQKKSILDSLIWEMENEKYFLYWRVN